MPVAGRALGSTPTEAAKIHLEKSSDHGSFRVMKPCAAYHFTPDGPQAIPLPAKQVLESLSEQQAAMFTPDGQSRMVVEMREKYLSGFLKNAGRQGSTSGRSGRMSCE